MTSFLVILLILFHFRISAKSNYKAAPYGMKNKNKKQQQQQTTTATKTTLLNRIQTYSSLDKQVKPTNPKYPEVNSNP